jgi:acyl carrier protein
VSTTVEEISAVMTTPQPVPPDVLAGVRGLVAKHFKRDAATISETTRFREDLNADSLDLVLVVHDVEDMFHVTIAQTDLEKVQTLGDAVAIVARSPRQ